MDYHRKLTSASSIYELPLLSKKELNRLPDSKIRDVQSLQLYLKSLQEKGVYSINSNFDSCSIDHEHFSNLVNDPISKDVLESDQDSITFPSGTHDFVPNESSSSDADSFSFASKEDSSSSIKEKHPKFHSLPPSSAHSDLK